ncbi:protein SHORT HYPOCOTYL IN WHITE LIGHT 1-like isoform X2 [Rhododendron vialii]|uniref:protein SHORT HYPOCOTYL IN WHITE LIGHT 1-like isoform X2 n=1 Tax=Rhododendron vialii TaxID=182163 RepID=UPI00265DF11F|nr:protein SHORT HYPOCOTYL IN WHITE LIGHT 1-like isoform X2 [Rhododendron vialii]
MGTSSVTLSPPHSLSSFPKTFSHSSNPPKNSTILQFQLRRLYPRVQASRRISNFPQVGLGIEDYADGDGDDDDGDDDEEEQEEDRSLDLLVKFVENVFKKVSRRARKAVRSVLPVTISSKLVGFSVNGVILLAFLWILKAFLEVW